MARSLVRFAPAAALVCALAVVAPPVAGQAPGNRPNRLEWFRDLGFGMFIHWSVDSQIGAVISHSLVGADADYLKRFFELPATFNPTRYDPRRWAASAKLAGMKYVVFTTKHHSGFCMYDTKTTPFGIMRTPYAKDVTAELVQAFRAAGIAIGFYFSPDDFYYLHTHGRTIAREPHPGVTPKEVPGLLDYDRAQLRELLTNYGPIDILFIDGPAEGLRELAWELQPNIVVTRGAMDTPEQRVPGVAADRAWESCITMGTSWQYRPEQDQYKSGTDLIRLLIETRAKGGNLLLNVGPKPDGELPIEQDERLRHIALWTMAFGESVTAVRPWVVTNEGDVWFTKRKDADTVYAIATNAGNWQLGTSRSFTFRSVKAGPDTRVRILGQTGDLVEYRPDAKPRASWTQEADGLHVTVTMAQRLNDDRSWTDPVAIEITHATPTSAPPAAGQSRADIKLSLE